MSKKVSSFTIVLDEDISESQKKDLMRAITMLKGVLKILPNVAKNDASNCKKEIDKINRKLPKAIKFSK